MAPEPIPLTEATLRAQELEDIAKYCIDKDTEAACLRVVDVDTISWHGALGFPEDTDYQTVNKAHLKLIRAIRPDKLGALGGTETPLTAEATRQLNGFREQWILNGVEQRRKDEWANNQGFHGPIGGHARRPQTGLAK